MSCQDCGEGSAASSRRVTPSTSPTPSYQKNHRLDYLPSASIESWTFPRVLHNVSEPPFAVHHCLYFWPGQHKSAVVADARLYVEVDSLEQVCVRHRRLGFAGLAHLMIIEHAEHYEYGEGDSCECCVV